MHQTDIAHRGVNLIQCGCIWMCAFYWKRSRPSRSMSAFLACIAAPPGKQWPKLRFSFGFLPKHLLMGNSFLPLLTLPLSVYSVSRFRNRCYDTIRCRQSSSVESESSRCSSASCVCSRQLTHPSPVNAPRFFTFLCVGFAYAMIAL